jgi:homoserine O-acetyltransferase
MASDIGACPRFAGDTRAALRAITARTLVMPSTSDLYFTVDDCAAEAAQIPGARFRPIHSWRGHRAGNPALDPIDRATIALAVTDLLSS